MIHLLWPTARPEQFKAVHQLWMQAAKYPDNVRTLVAVDTEAERDSLTGYTVLVVGKANPGVAAATYTLSSNLDAAPTDAVVLASDDFYAPPAWDEWVVSELANFNGCLIVRDGCQTGRIKKGRCVTIPIMTFDCLLKLNRIIYHPSYNHGYSDAELWFNLNEMGLIKNCRYVRYPMFEHRHWLTGKRNRDNIDERLSKTDKADKRNFQKRQQLPLAERLIIGAVDK